MSDRDFLIWLHERLVHVHNESLLSDHMWKLRAIIKDMDKDHVTFNLMTGENLTEFFDELITKSLPSIR